MHKYEHDYCGHLNSLDADITVYAELLSSAQVLTGGLLPGTVHCNSSNFQFVKSLVTVALTNYLMHHQCDKQSLRSTKECQCLINRNTPAATWLIRSTCGFLALHTWCNHRIPANNTRPAPNSAAFVESFQPQVYRYLVIGSYNSSSRDHREVLVACLPAIASKTILKTVKLMKSKHIPGRNILAVHRTPPGEQHVWVRSHCYTLCLEFLSHAP